MRQQGDPQAAFRATLFNVAEERPNLDDYRLLRMAMKFHVHGSEQSLIRDADHFLTTKALALCENTDRLRHLGNPLAPFRAIHNVGWYRSLQRVIT